MHYLNCLGAAIGGNPQAVKTFIESLPSKLNTEELKLIQNWFKFVKLERDLTLYVFYHDYFKWELETEVAWKKLCKLANDVELSHVFYRLGANPADHEESNNGEEAFFDNRMYDLFAFNFNIYVFHKKILNAFN